MLRKSLKYEWKYSMRFLIPVNCVLLILSFLGRLSINNNFLEDLPLFATLTLIFYTLGIFLISFFNYIYIAYRFYKNLFTDEGYLTFTLPIKPSTLLLSKLINAFLWSIINILMIFISILILIGGQPDIWNEFIKGWSELCNWITTTFDTNPIIFSLYVIVFIACSIVSAIVQIYAAVAIGHTSARHKVAASFIAYIILCILVSIISSVASYALGYMKLSGTVMFISSDTYTTGNTLNDFHLSLIIMIMITAILYFITNHIMNKKLNLE